MEWNEGRKKEYLVNALGKNHATEKILQIGKGIDLEGEAKIVELFPPPLVLLLDPLLLLTVVSPWPPHAPLEWAPRYLHQSRSLFPHPWLHTALDELHSQLPRDSEYPSLIRFTK